MYIMLAGFLVFMTGSPINLLSTSYLHFIWALPIMVTSHLSKQKHLYELDKMILSHYIEEGLYLLIKYNKTFENRFDNCIVREHRTQWFCALREE